MQEFLRAFPLKPLKWYNHRSESINPLSSLATRPFTTIHNSSVIVAHNPTLAPIRVPIISPPIERQLQFWLTPNP